MLLLFKIISRRTDVGVKLSGFKEIVDKISKKIKKSICTKIHVLQSESLNLR